MHLYPHIRGKFPEIRKCMMAARMGLLVLMAARMNLIILMAAMVQAIANVGSYMPFSFYQSHVLIITHFHHPQFIDHIGHFRLRDQNNIVIRVVHLSCILGY
ncbi:hypothetical protein BC834DRAFT_881225 [Gloeopeniophorella convolvens]|nr:hypothetical protein BC834DRAFT_881225 [Gloeopeniophorella convolvens]